MVSCRRRAVFSSQVYALSSFTSDSWIVKKENLVPLMFEPKEPAKYPNAPPDAVVSYLGAGDGIDPSHGMTC